MSKTGWIVIGVMVIVAAAGLWLWISPSAPAAPVNQGAASSAVPAPGNQGGTPEMIVTPSTDVSAQASATAGAAMSATVTYDGNSFSPSSVTIAKGGTVKFVDSAGSSMWVASAMHPSHTGYDGTSKDEHCAAGYTGAAPFDQCAAGASFSFTFDKVGSWGYHDHRNSSAFGTVVVQ